MSEGNPWLRHSRHPGPPLSFVVLLLLFHLGTSISKPGPIRPSRSWNQDRHLNGQTPCNFSDLDFKTWSCRVKATRGYATPATRALPPFVVIVLLFHLRTSISRLDHVRPSRSWNQDRQLDKQTDRHHVTLKTSISRPDPVRPSRS
jgi:hypothetical protein